MQHGEYTFERELAVPAPQVVGPPLTAVLLGLPQLMDLTGRSIDQLPAALTWYSRPLTWAFP